MLDRLLIRALEKALRVALRSSAIYGLALKAASLYSAGLPSPDDGRRALMAASPKPDTTPGIEPRCWPDVPECDISVIVPCYNVRNYVEDCLKSILSQKTSRTFEVIAIDDGSTDSTGEILDSLARAFPSLRVIHQPNRGLSGARNVGMANSRGGWLTFVDSDDMLEPGALEILADARESSCADIVTASYSNLSEDGRTVTPLSGKRSHGAPWGRLYSREVWRGIDFPERYWFEDTVQGF